MSYNQVSEIPKIDLGSMIKNLDNLEKLGLKLNLRVINVE